MKKSSFIIILVLGAFLFSCSDDEEMAEETLPTEFMNLSINGVESVLTDIRFNEQGSNGLSIDGFSDSGQQVFSMVFNSYISPNDFEFSTYEFVDGGNINFSSEGQPFLGMDDGVIVNGSFSEFFEAIDTQVTGTFQVLSD